MSPAPRIDPGLAGYGTPPGRVASTRFLRPRSRCPITTPPLVSSEPTRTGASGLRLQRDGPSTQPSTMQPLHQPQEHPLPRIPRQQPVDDPAGTPYDLTRDLDQRHAERAELHPQ